MPAAALRTRDCCSAPWITAADTTGETDFADIGPGREPLPERLSPRPSSPPRAKWRDRPSPKRRCETRLGGAHEREQLRCAQATGGPAANGRRRARCRYRRADGVYRWPKGADTERGVPARCAGFGSLAGEHAGTQSVAGRLLRARKQHFACQEAGTSGS